MKRAIVDVSSVIWTCLQGGKDIEHGKKVVSEAGKEVYVNSAEYGYEHAMNHLEKVMEALHVTPRQMIFVVEGQNSKQDRRNIHGGYKAGRDKVPEAYVSFNACKDMLVSAFLSVGAQAVQQDGGVEADDVLGYLAKHLKGEVVIVSGDKDLAQAIDLPRVQHYRAGVMNENPFGDFPTKFIPVAIALVGDSGDKIPGAKGFGEKALQMLHLAFGDDGLEMMEGLIQRKELLSLEEDVGTVRELQKIIDDAEGVYMSYELGRLRTERVNTMRRPLEWRAGMVKPRAEVEEQRLRKYAGVNRIISAENYDEACAFMKSKIAETSEFCLDLETMVGEESEDWLEHRTKKGGGVDVIGSRIVGCGLNFGNNSQYQFYLTHQHTEAPGCTNLALDQVRLMLELIPKHKVTVAHNAAGFELPVLYNHFNLEWEKNGWRGMFPNMIDSRIAASYWDEDQFSHGLKQLAKLVLGYEQESYDQVTRKDYLTSEWDGRGKAIQTYLEPILKDTGEMEEVETGHYDDDGIVIKHSIPKLTHAGDVEHTVVEYRMDQLTAKHVLGYGLDDVATTIALWNHFKIHMEIDDSYAAFLRLEQKPMYLSALSYVQGVPVSLERLNELKQADDIVYEKHQASLDTMLIARGWDGTVCPVYTTLDAASIKQAHLIVTGTEFKTLVRTPSKMAKLLEEDQPVLSMLINANDIANLNKLVASSFSGHPDFDVSSPKQISKLLYDTLAMPVRLRNPATDVMRAKGIREGTARTDDDAISMAQKQGDVAPGSIEYEVLTALKEMKSINTKRGLYYVPYPAAVHWKTRRIHPELVQSGTNTRRWASRNPNIQQLDSAYGGVRSIIKPHHRNAVVASLDLAGQEVRQAADYCLDPALLSCFMGTTDQLRDIHSIVGCKILRIPYRDLRSGEGLPENAGKVRNIAKVVLFASFYGAMAPKIAENLGISVEEAQGYIDAIYAQFPGLAVWKTTVEAHASKHGWVPVYGGTVRHLRKALLSENSYEQSKALRQASNASIQQAGASQMKAIMSSIWDSDLIEKYDYRWMFPVHDETVHSIGRADAVECLRALHKIMTQPFLKLVPCASSIGLGTTFGTLTEIGETFDPGRIENILNDIFGKEALAA